MLNSGLRKENPILIATLSSICDAVLIFIGALGFASFFIKFPILKISVGLIGVIFLFIYGLLKLKEAKGNLVTQPNPEPAKTIKKSILMTLGFSLLNPHVYLDTVVLIGGYSSKFADFSERIYFAAGASSFSTFWFFGLVFAASYGSRILNTPKSMRKVSFNSGLILIVLSIKLGGDVLAWLKEI